MAKKEVSMDLWVARQLVESKIKYDVQGSNVKEIDDALQGASKSGTGNAGYAAGCRLPHAVITLYGIAFFLHLPL